MEHIILVYYFEEADGTEQDFRTLDVDLAFDRARRYRLKVKSRKYVYESGSGHVLTSKMMALIELEENYES